MGDDEAEERTSRNGWEGRCSWCSVPSAVVEVGEVEGIGNSMQATSKPLIISRKGQGSGDSILA
jgi:hypothetical protein